MHFTQPTAVALAALVMLSAAAAEPAHERDSRFAPCRLAAGDAVAAVFAAKAEHRDSRPESRAEPISITTAEQYMWGIGDGAFVEAVGLKVPHCIANIFVVYEPRHYKHDPGDPCSVRSLRDSGRCTWISHGVYIYRLADNPNVTLPGATRPPSDPLDFLNRWDYSDDFVEWDFELEWVREGPPAATVAEASSEPEHGGRCDLPQEEATIVVWNTPSDCWGGCGPMACTDVSQKTLEGAFRIVYDGAVDVLGESCDLPMLEGAAQPWSGTVTMYRLNRRLYPGEINAQTAWPKRDKGDGAVATESDWRPGDCHY